MYLLHASLELSKVLTNFSLVLLTKVLLIKKVLSFATVSNSIPNYSLPPLVKAQHTPFQLHIVSSLAAIISLIMEFRVMGTTARSAILFLLLAMTATAIGKKCSPKHTRDVQVVLQFPIYSKKTESFMNHYHVNKIIKGLHDVSDR